MSYFELYKKRLTMDKGQTLEIRTNTNKRNIDDNFTITQGYQKATLNEHYDGDLVDIDIVVKSGASNLEKTIFFRPNVEVSNGAYITYSNRTYIMRDVDYDQLTPKSSCFLCNQTIKFKDYNIEIPCYTNSTTYGSKGIIDSDKFYELDSKTKLYIQRNKYTEQLKVGQRVMFAKKYVYKITELDDMVFPGMFIAVAIRDEILPMDDFENNIAHNEHDEIKNDTIAPIEYKIVGGDKLKVGEQQKYNIDINNCSWEIDDLLLASVVEQSDNEIIIEGTSVGWITLYCYLEGDLIDSKDIFVLK